jgi:hypothetical protein
MVIAASRSRIMLSPLGSVAVCVAVLSASVVGVATDANAQSSAAFATRPYVDPGSYVPVPPVQATPAPQMAQGQATAPQPHRGPVPVTMFRAVPPPFVQPEPVYQTPAPPPRPPYSIIAQSQRDAQAQYVPQLPPPQQPVWNPASLDEVVAPPMVASGPETQPQRLNGAGGVDPRMPQATGQRYHRRAMRRIFEDTRTSLTYDLPEGIADALPWVDRDRKNEPFDEVLARVADDLSRAAQSDPEWALPAQREIRQLSKKLDRFPDPPPFRTDVQEASYGEPQTEEVALNGRPFRPRPIWPGASGRPEAQVRPATIVTLTGTQSGPQATGVTAVYVPSTEDSPPEAAPRPRTSSRRAQPTRR